MVKHSPPSNVPHAVGLYHVSSVLGGIVVVIRVINVMSMTSVQEWFESGIMLCVV